MRLGRHVEIAGDREQAFEHPADRNLLDRQAADRLARGAQGRRELLDVVMRGTYCASKWISATRR